MASSGTNGSQLPKKQKAAQFHPSDQSVHINEVPVPSIKPDELLVKVRSASLCHSDLMLFEPNEQGLVLGTGEPFTMGHEGCGTIVEVGSEAKGFKKGDTVGWLPIVDCCFDCEACQVHNLYCESGQSKVQGMTVDGYFQQYCAVKWRNAAIMPEGMDLDNSAPIFCAGTTAFNAVEATRKELSGNSGDMYVAVIGCGGLGHLGIQYLKAHGFKVIGIDLSPEALEAAKASGADHVFSPKEDKDYVAQIRSITGKGCHAAINFTNSVPAYSSAPDVIRYNGVLMVTGIPQKPIPFSGMDLSMLKIRVRGANNGRTDQLRDCLAFSHKHGIKAHVTQYKLEDFQKMVDLMHAGQHKGRLGVLFD